MSRKLIWWLAFMFGSCVASIFDKSNKERKIKLSVFGILSYIIIDLQLD